MTKKDQLTTLQATPEQKKANSQQKELLKQFLKYGPILCSMLRIKDSLGKKLNYSTGDVFEIFYQSCIFMWLRTIMPTGYVLIAPPLIQTVLDELTTITLKALTPESDWIPHILNTSKVKGRSTKQKPQWLPRIEDLNRFINDKELFKDWWWKWIPAEKKEKVA